jgi:thioesterase domain-containing protein
MNDLKKQYADDLLKSIPVVRGMNVSIENLGDYSLRLKAPLDSNINYEGTAFGGSLNTACILSCYLLVHHVMKMNKVSFRSLVIQNSHIDYHLPVDDDFCAEAQIEENSALDLLRLLGARGRGRVSVDSRIETVSDSQKRVSFTGRFVATL